MLINPSKFLDLHPEANKSFPKFYQFPYPHIVIYMYVCGRIVCGIETYTQIDKRRVQNNILGGGNKGLLPARSLYPEYEYVAVAKSKMNTFSS